MSFRIMLSGGGSGGHVYPLVAVAEELLKQEELIGKKVDIRFIGDGSLIADAARDLHIPFRHVWAPKWRRYFSILNFLDVFKIPFGLAQAFFHVWLYMPDVMLVKGGYASFLPALAAKLAAVPLIVHESDSVPGKVNLFWDKHARRVFLSFEHARKYFKSDRLEVIGNPIRPNVIKLIDKAQALIALGISLQESKPVVFISGGSQGAQSINEVVLTDIVEMAKKFTIIHQCGDANLKSISARIEQIEKEEQATYGALIKENYRVFGHMTEDQMSQAYSAADVIVSRAGSTIFEIATVGKPVILIPFKDAASNHQMTNALEFAQGGAVVILEQDNLTPHILMNEITRAYEHRDELGLKIRQFARPDAATIIARELLEVAK